MQSEKQLEALVRNQYRPGETGNPGGAPRTKPISDALRALLAGDEAKWAKVPKPTQDFVTTMYGDALQGCTKSRALILDRVEGSLPRAVEEKLLPIVEFLTPQRRAPQLNGHVVEVEAEPVERE